MPVIPVLTEAGSQDLPELNCIVRLYMKKQADAESREVQSGILEKFE